MVEQLIEIPFPGRILVRPTHKAAERTIANALPSFVAGPENRLVADTFNRLIAGTDIDSQRSVGHVLALFGPSGVGKTHLAHGLVRHWQKVFGEEAAAYTTAADFRRLVIESIDTNSVVQFRDACRSRRLLVIDDLHRLPGDEYLLQELRYTLDAYEEQAGLVVVASHRPASTLRNLPADIRSRLAGGLSLQLCEPSTAARVQIIRHASKSLGRTLAESDAEWLAGNSSGTAVDLFGVLFDAGAPPLQNAAFNGSRRNESQTAAARRQITLQEIVAVVAKYTSVPQKQLKSGSRKQSIVFARAIAIYLARELAAASYAQIGRMLGGRDHSTIMHNFNKIEQQLVSDRTTQETISDLRRILTTR